MTLLTYSSSKIEKSNHAGLGYLTAIQYLAPSWLSGWNLCQYASDGCIGCCLNTAGRGRFDNVQHARINRTKLFFTDRPTYKTTMDREISAHIRKSKKVGMTPASRLNGTSDTPWEKVDWRDGENVMACYPGIQWYDYTKFPYRKRPNEGLPTNYHLTFSRSEKTTMAEMMDNLMHGRNVAVVFRKVIPETWFGIPVIDGDKHDMRFLDSKGVIVGLKAKGKAKKDKSGFVV